MEYSRDSLRAFLGVCEERSFTKAAKRLRLSQSTLSTKIALLEEQAGLKFFERSPRPLQLTEAGRVFLNFAREVNNRTEDLERLFVDLVGGIGGEVRIGAVSGIASYVLPIIVKNIREKYQKVRVTILAETVYRLWESVRQGEVDVAVILADRHPTDLVAKHLRNEKLHFVASPDHPLLRNRSVLVEQLGSTPLVMGLKGGAYTQMLEGMFEKQGLSEYTVVARISSFEGMKEITRAGIGVSILPGFTIRSELKEKLLVRMTVKGIDLSASFMLVERRRHAETPTITAVKQMIEKHILAM